MSAMEEVLVSTGDSGLKWEDLGVSCISPPLGWPDCFQLPPLASFISQSLIGKRVRACAPISEANASKLKGVPLIEEDSRTNAQLVRGKLGWEMLAGYAVYERSDVTASDGGPVFVARPFWWNVKSNGAWVDATPRGSLHRGDLVLVESDKVRRLTRRYSPG